MNERTEPFSVPASFNLLWLQSAGCGGCTMSLLCSGARDLHASLESAGVHVLWHPSLSVESGEEAKRILERCASGEIPLALTPPFQGRSVELQADASALASAEVRSVTVTIHYRLGQVEQKRTATLDAGRQPLSKRIDFLMPAGSQEYDYEIVWQLKGNRTVSSGRKRGSSAILFVDEVVAG